jgi:hypothetical protein
MTAVLERPTLRKYVVEVVREYPDADSWRDKVQCSEVILKAVSAEDAEQAAVAEVARLHPKATKIVVFDTTMVG